MPISSIIHGDLPGVVFDFEFFNGVIYHCCALKASFAFDTEGELQILEEQPPLMYGDYFDPDTANAVFENLPATAELLYPSDTTPFKPATDVIVIGKACSPTPRSEWICGLKIGSISKQLKLTGPRFWSRNYISGWKLSEPSPTIEVPLRYDRAFGGRLYPDKAFESLKPDELSINNPLGLGFFASHSADFGKDYPAPQIEYLDSPIRSDPSKSARVAGFSSVPGSFWSRLQLSGTYDAAWEKSVAPHIPLDMDLRYWNTAPPDQQVSPYLEGSELLSLTGFLASGDVNIKLPNLVGWAQVDYEDGNQEANQMWLDTVIVDLDKRQLNIRWGWLIKENPDIRRIQLACPRQSEWFAKHISE